MSTIEYYGIVTIEHYDKRKRLKNKVCIHNTGKKALFDLLCYFLANGPSTATEEDCPGKLMLYGSKNGEILEDPQLFIPLARTSRIFTTSLEGSKPCVRCTFYLPFSALKLNNISDQTYELRGKYISLFPSNFNSADFDSAKEYAQIQIPNEESIKPLSQGEYWSVAWELIFTSN